MIVALIALFLALGGSAVAVTQPGKNSVSSVNVKNNSLKGVDVKDGSLTGTDISLDVTTRSAGGIGPNLTAVISCQPGEVAVGGGGIVGDPNDQYITDSRPSPTSGRPTAWEVSFGTTGAGTPGTVYVVCAAL